MNIPTLVQMKDILSVFFVSCELMYNRKKTVIKLGTCTVNVICQLCVKYYVQ